MRKSNATYRPQVEALESRWVPAGNVTAQLVGDTLVVTGDQFDNNLVIYRDEMGIHLSGFDTSITGAAGEQIYEGVNNLVVDLANGDDTVNMPRLYLDGNLFIDTGEGSDFVDSFFLRVRGDAEIRTGANGLGIHGEAVNLARLFVDGTLTIDTGTGEDRVQLGGRPNPGEEPSTLGNLVIDTGEGNDWVDLTYLQVPGDVRLDGGNGQQDYLNVFFLGASHSRTIIGFEFGYGW